MKENITKQTKEREHRDWGAALRKDALINHRAQQILEEGENPGIFFDGPTHKEEFIQVARDEIGNGAIKIGIFGSRARTLIENHMSTVPDEKFDKHPLLENTRRILTTMHLIKPVKRLHEPLRSDIDIVVIRPEKITTSFTSWEGFRTHWPFTHLSFAGTANGMHIERLSIHGDGKVAIDNTESIGIVWIWEKLNKDNSSSENDRRRGNAREPKLESTSNVFRISDSGNSLERG